MLELRRWLVHLIMRGNHELFYGQQMSLMSTIVNLAQNFVGSNNINLLQPIGQFGTRLHGGKDAASPRYIFTALRYLETNNKYLSFEL